MISAKTSAEVAQGLVKRGAEVTVCAAFPNRPGGRLYPGYRLGLYQADPAWQHGALIRCWGSFSRSSSLPSRLAENLTFGLTSSLRALFLPKPDVIYANTWPLLAQGLTALVARLRGVPLVLNIQDLYPESLSVQGRIQPNHWLYRLLRRLDIQIARSASRLVVISESFKHVYTQDRGIPAEKIVVIPNWVDPQEIDLLPKEQFRQKAGIPANAFVVAYGGNIGAAAGVEAVIRAFAGAPDGMLLLVAGDGSRKTECQSLAGKLGVQNIQFHSPWLKEETSEVLRAADVLVLPTQGQQSMASVPSKMLNYMLAARPILAVAVEGSETAEIIQKAGCGWVVPPGDEQALSAALRQLSEIDPALLEQMGQNGRAYAMEHFSKDVCLPRVIDVVMEITGNGE